MLRPWNNGDEKLPFYVESAMANTTGTGSPISATEQPKLLGTTISNVVGNFQYAVKNEAKLCKVRLFKLTLPNPVNQSVYVGQEIGPAPVDNLTGADGHVKTHGYHHQVTVGGIVYHVDLAKKDTNPKG
jgi:hypothetical protein